MAYKPRTRKPLGLKTGDWQRLTTSNLTAATALLNLYLAGFALETALKGKTYMEGIEPESTRDLKELLYASQVFRAAKATAVPYAVSTRLGAVYPTYLDLFGYLVNTWDNELRYSAAGSALANAREFVMAVEEMVGWIWTA
jgi:hypothetical protein